MAFSSLYPFARFKIPCKKCCGAIKRYSSADNRIWSNDAVKKSNALRDILTTVDFEQFSSNNDDKSISPEIEKLLEELKEKNKELEEIHKKYTALSKQLKDFEKSNKDNRKFQEDDDIKAQDDQFESVKKRAEKYEEILKERDELKQELSKLAKLEELLKKLKMRADDAEKMEQEIAKLKEDLKKCGHGGSGDKLQVEPTRSSSDTQCNQCQQYEAELKESKSMLELREKKCTEIEAERNFLRQRAEMIRCMEAEMILYKTKYDECECKMLNLKETIVRAEINERKLRESQSKLKKVECQLMESEQQNEDLIEKIEQLDMDLKERDVFIECLNKRLQSKCSPQKAIDSEKFVPGKVQSIIKRMSKECPNTSTCKCNIENCHCAVVGKSLCTDSKESDVSECCENVLKNENYWTECCKQPLISISEADRLKMEMSSNEVKILRQQNQVFDKEIQRLQKQLACLSQIVEEFEQERSTNSSLESEINELKSRHSQELEEVNSSYRSSICQKLSDLQCMEQKLVDQIEKRCELERRLTESSDQLNEMKRYKDESTKLRESFKSLEICHKERLKEMEGLNNECAKNCEEIARLKMTIEGLNKEICDLKAVNRKYTNVQSVSKDQCSMIKKSVMELKRFKDERTYMIKCYEKKIRIIEAENERLKCFRDKCIKEHETKIEKPVIAICDDILYRKLAAYGIDSLDYEELTELHDRVRCAMIKVTKKVSHVDIDVNYNKMIAELCQKYNISSSKELILDNLPTRDNRDFDVSSVATYPRRLNKFGIKKIRSKSSEMTKKSVCK